MTYTLQKRLEDRSGLKLQLKFNNNRSTMLSVKWEPDCTKVSLHKMFLEAPKNVMDALACYLKQEDKNIAPTVRAFIENNLQKLDYYHQLDPTKLYCQGHLYNLQDIYDDLNREYFNNDLNLRITWYGRLNQTFRSRFTFGLYHDAMKLIKINRVLDSPSFPHYLISYVIYHEMVHHVCPSYYDAKGQHHVHTKEFRNMEEKFRHFELAQKWIEKNRAKLFF